MAEIQMVYRKGRCEVRKRGYCGQCHTQAAGACGCREFYPDLNGCTNAVFDLLYKGVTAKKYDIEPSERDDYNPHLDCMVVKVGGKTYECEKVILNGECIYNGEEECDG